MKTSDQIEGFLFTWVLEGGKRLIYFFLRKGVLHDIRHTSLGDIPLGFRGISFFLLAGEGSNMLISLCSIFLPKVAFPAVWESLGKEEEELFEARREAAQNSHSPGMPAIVELGLQPRYAWLSPVTSVAEDVKAPLNSSGIQVMLTELKRPQRRYLKTLYLFFPFNWVK